MQVGNITESSWAKAGSAYQTKSDNITKTDNKTQKASQASPKANDNSKPMPRALRIRRTVMQ